MKTPKHWTVEIRKALGNCLRCDPIMTEGSLIEILVDQIQEDARAGATQALRNLVEKIESYSEPGALSFNPTLKRLAEEGRKALDG